jgi:hypothetical protein
MTFSPLAFLPGVWLPRPFRRQIAALRLLACAALLVFAGSAAAAAQNAPAQPLYRIAGSVLDRVSSDPVARASVAIVDTEAGQTISSTYTDANGHFAFADVPEGRYQLVAAKRGFLRSMYEEHDIYTSAIVTGPGLDTGKIVFRLTPAATLSVTVRDETGDPVADASILLFRKERIDGVGLMATHFNTSDSNTTDDTGLARIGNLPPGEYYLAVSAKPWYALDSGSPIRENTERNPALDVAYPITFNNGVTDQNAATPIQLSAGQMENLQITLQATPALHLTLPDAAGKNANQSQPTDSLHDQSLGLTASIFGFSFDAPGATVNNEDGRTEITGIAPGHYDIEAGDPPRRMEFDAANSQQFAANAGAAAATLHVKLMQNGKPAKINDLTLDLHWADRAHPRPYPNAVQQGDEYVFSATPPGQWELFVHDKSNYPYPVLSIAGNGAEHPGNAIRISEGARELTVQIGLKQGHISGFARVGKTGKAGVLVLLIPSDPVHHSDLFRRDQADSDGSFNLLQVGAGDYTIVAIDDGWDLEWQRPEILARFLSHGVAVHVGGGSQKPIQLSAPIPIQNLQGELLLPDSGETSDQSSPGTSSKPGGEGSL